MDTTQPTPRTAAPKCRRRLCAYRDARRRLADPSPRRSRKGSGEAAQLLADDLADRSPTTDDRSQP